MCNLSAGIWEDAMTEGLREGRKEGRREGRREGLNMLKSLVNMGKLALKDAAQAANMSPEEFKAAVNM